MSKITKTCGVVVTSLLALTLSHLLSDFNSMSASGKCSFLMDSIYADPHSDGYMNPLETLYYVSQTSYLWMMQFTYEDWRNPDHHKATHGLGGHARAHFEWKENKYTGMFQQADHCVLRIANAATPGGVQMGSYGPNMAVKCLRDATPQAEYNSANLLFIWQLDGYAKLPEGKSKSCSYFEAPLANGNPVRDDIQASLKDIFIPAFNRVDHRSMRLGVSGFAEAVQNGTDVAKPHFPFTLVMLPAPGLNNVGCTFSEPNSQLLSLSLSGFTNGSTLYEVYAVEDPDPQPTSDSIQHIGSLVLDSDFTSSHFGDTQLFFQHRFWEKEVAALTKINPARAQKWQEYLDNESNYKVEGASLYWPLLPKHDAELVV